MLRCSSRWDAMCISHMRTEPGPQWLPRDSVWNASHSPSQSQTTSSQAQVKLKLKLSLNGTGRRNQPLQTGNEAMWGTRNADDGYIKAKLSVAPRALGPQAGASGRHWPQPKLGLDCEHIFIACLVIAFAFIACSFTACLFIDCSFIAFTFACLAHRAF